MMLRLGVVGMGFGRTVVLPALAGLDGVTITALADGGSGQAGAAAAELSGTPRLFNDGRALAEAPDIDAVVVACPPAMQKEITAAALSAGKHVLCEKPVGLDGDTEGLHALAMSTGRVAAVGFEMRYEPGITALSTLIQNGQLGEIRSIAVTWLTAGGANPGRPWSWRHDRALGGGLLSEYGSHVLDYLNWLAGPFDILGARLETRVTQRPGPNAVLRAVTGEDGCDLLLNFHTGASGHVTIANTVTRALGHRIEIVGDRAVATWLLRPPFRACDASLEIEDANGRRLATLDETPADDSRIAAYRLLLRDFIDAAAGADRSRLPRFSDAVMVRRAMATARALCPESKL